MPRLFTASDIERAARLAAQNAMLSSNHEIEPCVTHAVAIVAGESPLYYSEEEVRQMLQYLLSKEDVDAEFEDALNMVRR